MERLKDPITVAVENGVDRHLVVERGPEGEIAEVLGRLAIRVHPVAYYDHEWSEDPIMVKDATTVAAFAGETQLDAKTIHRYYFGFKTPFQKLRVQLAERRAEKLVLKTLKAE